MLVDGGLDFGPVTDIPQEEVGIDTAAARTSFMQAILDWFAVDSSTDVDVPSGAMRFASAPKARPNPFNPATEIAFSLAGTEPTQVAVDVYDLQGRHVAHLWRGDLGPGTHAMSWDGRDRSGLGVASGTYLARVKVGNSIRTSKLILAK